MKSSVTVRFTDGADKDFELDSEHKCKIEDGFMVFSDGTEKYLFSADRVYAVEVKDITDDAA